MNATPRPRPGDNVVQLLKVQVDRHPMATALCWDGAFGRARRLTYQGLWDRSGQTMAQLRRAGVGPGDRVLVCWPLGPDLYTCLVAILRRGATALFVDPWTSGDTLAGLVAQQAPRAFLGSPRARLLRLLRPALRRIPRVALRGHPYGASHHARSRPEEIRAQDGEDLALLTFTSGSSGTPKGVRRTHRILAAQHRALARAFPPRPGDVDCTNLPVFVLHNLALGVPSLLPRLDVRHLARVRPARLLRQWRRHGVTTGTFSPSLLDRVAGFLRSHAGPPPGLRRVLAGGAAMGEAQVRGWRQAFPESHLELLYGSSEAEPVAHVGAGARAGIHRRRRGPGHCVGRPVPEVEVRILAERPGDVGEVLVRGAHVCGAYEGDPAATRRHKILDADGSVWHRMGDAGYLDARGRLWLVGQVHARIRHRTGTLHAGLVEQVVQDEVRGAPAVAALAAPGPGGFQRLVLVVHGPPDARLEGELRAALARRDLPLDGLLFRARPLPTDPRHQSKVDRRALGRWLEEHQEEWSWTSP